jgi:hypothetical protein
VKTFIHNCYASFFHNCYTLFFNVYFIAHNTNITLSYLLHSFSSAPIDDLSVPITAAHIHIPFNLTLSSNCFLLDSGCSRLAAGDGSVYTRHVDQKAQIFHLESRSCSKRKKILTAELAALSAAIDHLMQVSQQRQAREDERKLRYQLLQQQQQRRPPQAQPKTQDSAGGNSSGSGGPPPKKKLRAGLVQVGFIIVF